MVQSALPCSPPFSCTWAVRLRSLPYTYATCSTKFPGVLPNAVMLQVRVLRKDRRGTVFTAIDIR
jgi:hypothetical protein